MNNMRLPAALLLLICCVSSLFLCVLLRSASKNPSATVVGPMIPDEPTPQDRNQLDFWFHFNFSVFAEPNVTTNAVSKAFTHTQTVDMRV